MLDDTKIIEEYGHVVMLVLDVEPVQILNELDMVNALLKYAVMLHFTTFRNGKYQSVARLINFGLWYAMRLF